MKELNLTVMDHEMCKLKELCQGDFQVFLVKTASNLN